MRPKSLREGSPHLRLLRAPSWSSALSSARVSTAVGGCLLLRRPSDARPVDATTAEALKYACNAFQRRRSPSPTSWRATIRVLGGCQDHHGPLLRGHDPRSLPRYLRRASPSGDVPPKDLRSTADFSRAKITSTFRFSAGTLRMKVFRASSASWTRSSPVRRTAIRSVSASASSADR